MSFEDGLDSYKMPTNWKTTDHLNLGPSSSPPRSSFWLASIDLRVNRNLWVIYCPLHNLHGLLLVKTVVHVMVIRNSLWGIRMRDYSQFHMVKCWDTIFVDRWWKSREVSPDNLCRWYECGTESWKFSQNLLFIDCDNMGIPIVLDCVSVTCPLWEGTG